jgi:predicted metal-binding protein
MDSLIVGVSGFARQLGIETCFEFEARMLVPQRRIRGFCAANKCGNYGDNYLCPPYIGSLREIKARLKTFRRGVLLWYLVSLDVSNDREGVERTKVAFHNKILQLEDFFENEKITPKLGMIGGSCGLCPVCLAKFGQPCRYPDRARASLESMGIDVQAFLAEFGLDNRFHPDRITWSGCILL